MVFFLATLLITTEVLFCYKMKNKKETDKQRFFGGIDNVEQLLTNQRSQSIKTKVYLQTCDLAARPLLPRFTLSLTLSLSHTHSLFQTKTKEQSRSRVSVVF